MIYIRLAIKLFLVFVCIYFIGIAFVSIANAFGFYEKYFIGALEFGFLFRVFMLMALSFASWRYSCNVLNLVFCAIFLEMLLVVFASAGYIFSSTEFLVGTPIGLIFQDFFSYIGIGFFVVRFGWSIHGNFVFLDRA